MNAPELAISVTRAVVPDWTGNDREARAKKWLPILDDPQLAEWVSAFVPTHLYFGSEFCEHLLASPRELNRALEAAHGARLKFVLLTPIASPRVIRRLADLLPLLPQSAAVVVNDWGVAHFVAENFPALHRSAGRILCRMIKDPRLAGSEWAHQCTPGLDSPHLRAMFERLGLERIEMDVPMFAVPEDFSAFSITKSVHIPFSCVAKGRMCRPGSLSVTGPERFAVGRKCRKECLSFSARTKRPGSDDRLDTVHLGNTILSRLSRGMLDAVQGAVQAGAIERLIVPGDAP